MKQFAVALALMLAAILTTSGAAFAKGGHGKGHGHAYSIGHGKGHGHAYAIGRGYGRPPGWYHGRKVGWRNMGCPPGLWKQGRC